MRRKSLVAVAAWLEIIVGATLVADLNLVCELLFAAAPQGVGVPLGRIAGIALFALGVGGLRSTGAGLGGSGTLGLFVYNAGGAIVLAWVAVETALRGVLLWPGVVLHAVIACGLLWTSLSGTRRAS